MESSSSSTKKEAFDIIILGVKLDYSVNEKVLKSIFPRLHPQELPDVDGEFDEEKHQYFTNYVQNLYKEISLSDKDKSVRITNDRTFTDDQKDLSSVYILQETGKEFTPEQFQFDISSLPSNIDVSLVEIVTQQSSDDNITKKIHGYAAGQEYDYDSAHFGGPSNMLCLPKDPELSNRTGSASSRLYGTEFEGNYFAPGSANEDVPCALCRGNNTSSSVMIPGRKSCYSGWKKEYFGILASNCYSCKASSYICVDMNPEFIAGGERNDNNNLLYATSMKCGSLPCPPYHNDLEVYCVVCSK
ncbi:unnamed protein product [Mytilus edulis]|uniref:Uncharacterized protein n=1 Tax=Mytilus edulis TaxID=6550 RepID=A0A8S3UTQ6_MYTED|nr:unnamed protein product [Mytilus edulis]